MGWPTRGPTLRENWISLHQGAGQLPRAPQWKAGRGVHSSLQLASGVFAGLVLFRFCADNHSCYESISSVILACPRLTVFTLVLKSFWFLQSVCPLFCDGPWALWGRSVIRCTVCGWAFHRHLFSILRWVVTSFINYLPLNKETYDATWGAALVCG